MQKHLYHQPLVHARVWDKRIKALGASISIPPEHAAALQHWAQTIRDKSIEGYSETNLRGAFIDTLFIKVLGYTQFGTGADCTILTERPPNHNAAADVNLGLFTADTVSEIAVVEGG